MDIARMSEREFWLEMRRGMLTMARAIELRYGKREDAVSYPVVPTGTSATTFTSG